jgi:lysophospholipase L1-like esterase
VAYIIRAMKQLLSRSRLLGVALGAISTAAVLVQAQAPVPKHRIAIFGSSVANGTGDELNKEGYTGRLRDMLAPRGWQVFNQSRGGDNTKTMAPRWAPDGEPRANTKYLMTANPDYVMFGLSLGNEGIKNGTTTAEKDAIYAQFESGMREFVAKARANHIVPIVTLCYTRNDFTELEYGYTRRMNLLISSTWDVPSANFLGAVDDGTGKWAKGFWWDSLHPNASGHDELTATIVPTLFDALDRGTPMPKKSTAAGFVRITNGFTPIEFEPADLMHPFALAFDVRGESPTDVAVVSGVMLDASTQIKHIERGRGGAVDLEETTLATSNQPALARVSIVGGAWTYTSANGHDRVQSTVQADGQWHHIVLSHYTARGETLFFVDGQLAGRTAERFQPKKFVLGGPGAGDMATPTRRLDVKELMIYRSALNADEAAALAKGALLQASLEVYSPLNDASFKSGQPVINLAQATTFATVGDGVMAHMDR